VLLRRTEAEGSGRRHDQGLKNALGEAFTTSLESAKWKLWHGHPQDALTKLAVLRDNLTDEGHRSKLTGLYEYLVNYDARDQANKTYTSQVTESHIEALINARSTFRTLFPGSMQVFREAPSSET
jgi:hypothetical protein